MAEILNLFCYRLIRVLLLFINVLYIKFIRGTGSI